MSPSWDQNPEFREINIGEVLNKKLSTLFKEAPLFRLFFIGAIVVILGWFVLNSYFTIQPGEEGVVRRLGKYVVSKQEGIHFKMPLIDRVDVVKVQKVETQEFGFRTESVGTRSRISAQKYLEESEMLTGDMNIVDLQFTVQYKIKSATDYLFNVRDPEKALRDASESAMRQIIGDRGLNEATTTGREEIIMAVKDKLQELLDTYQTGIVVVNVKLRDVNPPENVIAAWGAVVQAQQYKKQRKNEAQQKLNEAIPQAEGMATRVIAEASAYKIERINRARGDQEKFLNILREYQLAKDITRRRLYLEAMEEVMAGIEDKVIVDEDVSRNIFNLLNLNREQ